MARRLLAGVELADHGASILLGASANSTRGAPTFTKSPLVPNTRAMRPLHGDGIFVNCGAAGVRQHLVDAAAAHDIFA